MSCPCRALLLKMKVNTSRRERPAEPASLKQFLHLSLCIPSNCLFAASSKCLVVSRSNNERRRAQWQWGTGFRLRSRANPLQSTRQTSTRLHTLLERRAAGRLFCLTSQSHKFFPNRVSLKTCLTPRTVTKEKSQEFPLSPPLPFWIACCLLPTESGLLHTRRRINCSKEHQLVI